MTNQGESLTQSEGDDHDDIVRAARVVPTAEEQPTMDVPEAGACFGLGRTSSYEAVRRGDLPSIHLGRKVRVPTAAVRKMLLLDEP
jgi:predicted DNA-binding transcriptional regulator AlpA